MRSSKINYVLVGVFVLAMIFGTVAALATLTGWSGPTDKYFATYRNVTGVKYGTQVLYEGYPIGQVTGVTPMPSQSGMAFRVDFEVLEDWRIPQDSLADIAAPGLLAAVTISIKAGESTAALEPGKEVTSREATSIFTVVSTVAEEINRLTREDLRPLLKNLDGAVSSFTSLIDNDARLVFADLHTMSGEVTGALPDIVHNLESFAQNANAASEQLQAFLTDENRDMVSSILANLDGAALNMAQLSIELEQTRGHFESLIVNMDGSVADNREDIRAAISDLKYVAESVARNVDSFNHNLDGAARNLNEFSRQIRQNPGLLLGGTKPDPKAE
ncbi:MAG: MCE family protein [Rhodobacterales bacterium]|nr:MCE family protein [Rhodobacterales bacterium]